MSFAAAEAIPSYRDSFIGGFVDRTVESIKTLFKKNPQLTEPRADQVQASMRNMGAVLSDQFFSTGSKELIGKSGLSDEIIQELQNAKAELPQYFYDVALGYLKADALAQLFHQAYIDPENGNKYVQKVVNYMTETVATPLNLEVFSDKDFRSNELQILDKPIKIRDHTQNALVFFNEDADSLFAKLLEKSKKGDYSFDDVKLGSFYDVYGNPEDAPKATDDLVDLQGPYKGLPLEIFYVTSGQKIDTELKSGNSNPTPIFKMFGIALKKHRKDEMGFKEMADFISYLHKFANLASAQFEHSYENWIVEYKKANDLSG